MRPTLEIVTVEESYRRCHQLTQEHYENFPVAKLVPKKIRPHVSAVYAFARTSDDIADEDWDTPGGPTPEERLADLAAFEDELLRAVAGQPLEESRWEWIFVALADTLEKCNLPLQLFLDLLSAFKQDVTTTRYATFAEVLDYCRRSANPIGRLVLLLHGYREEKLFTWSDQICTALQLANFWQDVSIDIRKDRIYVPQEDWEKHNITEATFRESQANPNFKACLKAQVDRTSKLFAEGRVLSRHLKFPLSMEIKLTWLGGQTILEKIVAADYDTLKARPKLQGKDKITLLRKAAFSR